MQDTPNRGRLAMEVAALRQRHEPPCTVSGVDLIYLRFEVDRAAAQRLLPPGFECDPQATGCIGLYTSTSAQGVAPHEACFFALGIADYETPDRDVGLFIVGDLRSEPASSVFRTHYCRVSTPGWARIERDGDRVIGEAGPENGPWLIRIEGRLTAQTGTPHYGSDHYFARTGDGGCNFYTTTGRHRFADLAQVSVTIPHYAPNWIRAFRPLAITTPVWSEGAELVFGIPQPRELGAEKARREELVDLFSTLGRPALIVGQNGRVAHANRESGELAVDLRDFAARSEIAAAITTTLATRAPAPAVHVPRAGGGEPLLVQALPLTPALAGELAVLLLFNNPARPRLADPATALLLLGLTRSEARLATLVGGGKAPRLAAQTLGISEGNARTTLKAVFAKLGLTRQAELARLVGRLEQA